jgi:hypothetical protein
MPEGVIAEVVDGFATIDFVDAKQRGPALQRLIAIGGPGSIETVTREGPRRKYRVPEGNAQEAGLLDGSSGDVLRGDSGYAEALRTADTQQRENPDRPAGPSTSQTYVGTTSVTEARQSTAHVSTTTAEGSGTGETIAPPHGDVIEQVNKGARKRKRSTPTAQAQIGTPEPGGTLVDPGANTGS